MTRLLPADCGYLHSVFSEAFAVCLSAGLSITLAEELGIAVFSP